MQDRAITTTSNRKLAYKTSVVFNAELIPAISEFAESLGGAHILFTILKNVKRPEDILTFMLVSREFYDLFHRKALWKNMVRYHNPEKYLKLKLARNTTLPTLLNVMRKKIAHFRAERHYGQAQHELVTSIKSGDLYGLTALPYNYIEKNIRIYLNFVYTCPSQGLRDYVFQHFIKRPELLELRQAAYLNQVAYIRKLLKAGIITKENIDTCLTPNSTETLLKAAAEYGHTQLVQLLLDAGADPKIQNSSIICTAAKNGYTNIVKLLIEHGANFTTDNDSSVIKTPLLHAIENGHYKTVQVLIDNGVNVNTKFNAGPTPLDLALRIGNKKIINALLAANAQMTDKLVIQAIDRNDVAFLKRVLKANPSINLNSTLNPNRPQGITPLMHAVRMASDDSILAALVKAGADINFTNGDPYCSPIMIAAKCGDIGTVKALIKFGADCNTLFECTNYSYFIKMHKQALDRYLAAIPREIGRELDETLVHFCPAPKDAHLNLVQAARQVKLALYIKNAKHEGVDRERTVSSFLGIKLYKEYGHLYKVKFSLFGKSFGISEHKKLKAAKAIKYALKDNINLSTLKDTKHKKALNQGELKTIYRSLMKK